MASDLRPGQPGSDDESRATRQIAGAAELARLAVQDALLTVAEAAKFLKVSRSLVYVMLRSGDIPSVRFRRVLRVSARDLREYMQKSRVNRKKSRKGKPRVPGVSTPVVGRLAKWRREHGQR